MPAQPARSTAPARRRWLRVAWIATFTPICVGLLVAGVAFHWVFLAAGLLWAGALGCVLRVEAIDHRSRDVSGAAPRQQLAKSGWLLLALVLIFAGAGVVRVAFE